VRDLLLVLQIQADIDEDMVKVTGTLSNIPNVGQDTKNNNEEDSFKEDVRAYNTRKRKQVDYSENNHHANNKKLACDFCGCEFNILNNLIAHTNLHALKFCNEKEMFDPDGDLNSFSRPKLLDFQEPKFMCDVCPRVYHKKSSLYSHRYSIHSKSKIE